MQNSLLKKAGTDFVAISSIALSLNMNKQNTILIVDDDQGMIEIISNILRNAGYNTISDTTGKFEFIETNRSPDLILLDNYLGTNNGADLCSLLKKNERTKHIPVILISGAEGLYSIADKACADDFLTKPFSIQNLLRKIEFLLSDLAATS